MSGNIYQEAKKIFSQRAIINFPSKNFLKGKDSFQWSEFFPFPDLRDVSVEMLVAL